jgi:hypothetical protein
MDNLLPLPNSVHMGSQKMSAWLGQAVNRKLLLVLSLACLSFGIGIDWGLPQAVSPETVAPWELDSVAPIMPLNEAYYLFTRNGNEWVTYPLFHFIVLDIIYAPYLVIQYLFGNFDNPSSAFPYGMEDPVRFCRDLTLLARLVGFIMGLGIVFTVFKITAELFSDRAAFWAALMTIFLAPLTYYAKVSNIDVPYIFWSCIALFQYIRLIKAQRLRNYIGFAICAALAVATKDQAYGFFVLIPPVIIYALAHHRANGSVTLKDIGYALLSKPSLLSMLVAAAVFAVANNLIFGGWSGFTRHIAHITGAGSQPWRMFPNTFAGQLSLVLHSIELLGQTFGYGSLALCIGGIGYTVLKRHWLACSILLFHLSYLVFFLAIVGYAYPRFLLGPAILLTPFAGALIVHLLEQKRAVRIPAGIGVVGCLLWQVFLTAHLTLTLMSDSRYQAESWIKANLPPGSRIESQVSHERLLPHISKEYKITLRGQSEMGPLPEELSAEALRKRDPQYILLGSLGFSHDPENWQDAKLTAYRDALLSGQLGYIVLAKFETPHFIPYRQLIGTRPAFILLAKASEVQKLNLPSSDFSIENSSQNILSTIATD